jgi:uncharacterized protein (TIGR02099 family)
MRLQPSAFFDPVVRRLRCTPWQAAIRLAWQTFVFLGLALLGLLVLAWLTLQWGILPHIEDWRPAIERHASRAVGVPVRIGHISVRSSGWVPAVDLRDVVLSDRAGTEALRLPRVSAALSPRSLLVLEPRLAQLYIEDARLLVRRDADGRLHVGGLDLEARGADAASSDDGAALDWFFSQEELVLRRGTLRWVDEQRRAPALELTGVDVVVRNGLRSHELRIDATPPADWGERASLRALCRQPLFARAGDWRRWSGTLYADLPRGDVSQLRHHVDLPFELDGGEGAVKLWLDFQNEHWRAATADLQLRDVGLRLASTVEPLAIARAGGRLSAQRTPAGVTLAAEHFGFETAAGVTWPAGDLRLAWREQQASLGSRPALPGRRAPRADAPAASAVAPSASDTTDAQRLPWDSDAPVTGGQLSADHLDLGLMRRLAAALPLPPEVQRWLADYRPDGVVRGLAARWDGPLGAPDHYRANATISGMAIAAGEIPASGAAGRPGWRNADMNFDASELGGVAHVALDGGAVDLPGVFEEPVIAFEKFGASVSWRIDRARDASRPPPVTVTLRDVRFSNADLEGELQLQWRTGAGIPPAAAPASPAGSAPAFGLGQRFPGLIDLKGEVAHARAAKLARYLPQHIPADTRSYLRAAFPSGELEAVKFAVHGDLADFPYHRLRDGEFRIDGRVVDAVLDYVPGPAGADGERAPSAWPVFTQVRGQIVLDRGALEIRDAQARMGELALQGVHGGFASLYDRPALALQGRVAGPMPEFLRYVAQSPIGGWLHNGLANMSATGNAELTLALAIPLAKADATTVKGTLALAGNDVRVASGAPLLQAARARVDFTERGVAVSGGAAHVLGGEATFDGGTQADGALRFNAQGTVTADGLRRVADEPMLARLAQSLSGQAAYRLAIGIAHGQTEFALTSPLAGLGLALPAPLDKPADAAWPLRVSTVVSFDPQGRPRDTLHVDLGHWQQPLLLAEVQRDLSGPIPRPQRLAYAIGAPLPPPQPGGVAVVRSAALNGDAWWAFWRGLSAAPASPEPAPPADAAAPPSAGSGYWPRAASLAAQDMLLGGRHLSRVDMQLAQTQGPDGELWRVGIASDQTHGVVEYRPESPLRVAQLFARLDRLSLDADADAGKAAPAPPSPPSPITQIPALDIVVDNFEFNSKQLGKLEVAATLQPGAHDWRLTRLALTTPEARFSGSGVWSGAPARHMALDFKLELQDSGAFLQRLAMGRVLKGGKGELSGAVAWTGSPLALDYPSLHGQLKVALDAGQFLKADAGAGRLLGVLSLQSLPRRLTLDFRDLFQEGFAFDNVTGDVLIDRGVATTKDLRMRGLNAAVLMAGSADLKAETQDLRVVVVPELNAGAASLAYAAINPVIGIGTFLAQLFLRNPIAEAGTREFHVVGSWADPKVEQVEHKQAVEAAAQARAADAASAASAAAN